MQSALGLLGFVLYIAVIVAVAAGVTWLVVKISPAKKRDSAPPA
ncbi:MAG: hypothetical protein QOI27_959 [Gaiellaceae bacterium]|jgi:hypothetical protein|nr:hypothetical protein [Gaiellaceae bacterium]MDX6471114.1 hypothetical protein [Gaiellaceae bacterium]MDX6472995.1 hypothetical protein [Gaiellaceae bacterium]